MRTPALRKPSASKLKSFPAPVGGWIANENLATPQARRPDGTKVNGAAVLENWFPTATGVRMRGGSQRYAFLGDGSLPVTSLFSYANGNTRALFASTVAAVYDITTVTYAEDQFLVDDDGAFLVDDTGDIFPVFPATPDEAISSLTGGDWSVVQFATSGGVFLRAVNGVDTPQVYDGSAWGTSPAITGATPTTLSHVWAFKNRLFFIQNDTLDVWYLPVDSIGGLAVKFPLGGVFTKGGSLMFGAAWSLDTGSGLNEQCVFVTSEGEVAVYQGSDPASADTWSRVGVYRIGKPRGPKAFIRAGGDLVIATDIGFVPLSQAIQRDLAALSPSAVSYPIEVAWNEIVAEHPDADWQCIVWPTKQMVVVAHPTGGATDLAVLVANARTGAWAQYTEWDVLCLEVFGDRMFFGTNDGRIIEAEVTGSDQGATYVATCVPLFDPLKTPASLKTGMLARAVLRAPSAVEAQLSLQKDYTVSLPAAPDDISVVSEGVWGTGIWGETKWGGAADKITFQDWRSIAGSGYSLSVATQITSGSISAPDVELVQTDLTYEIGDIGS
jgi:hypothetical protein